MLKYEPHFSDQQKMSHTQMAPLYTDRHGSKLSNLSHPLPIPLPLHQIDQQIVKTNTNELTSHYLFF